MANEKWLHCLKVDRSGQLRAKQALLFISLTESGSREMKERVRDCWGEPSVWDPPWGRSPSCSSLTGETVIDIRSIGAASDTCMTYSFHCCQMCQMWTDKCVFGPPGLPVCVVWSVGGWVLLLALCLCHSPLSSLHLHWSFSKVHWPEWGSKGGEKVCKISQLNNYFLSCTSSKTHIHCIAELQDTSDLFF